MWEWILRMWDNGERNIKLEQAGFIDMDHLSGDSRLLIWTLTLVKKTRCQKSV